MATEAGICNVALLRVGVRKFLEDLSGSSVEAQACSALFEPLRDAVLQEFSWRFATKRASLTVLSSAERSGWEYVYSLPSDFLFARYIYPSTTTPNPDQRVPFELEMNDTDDGKVLVCNLEDAELVYVAKVDNPGLWTPLFCDALSWRIAADLARALPVKPQVAQAMDVGYQRALNLAIAAELRNEQSGAIPEAESIRARG